MLHKFIAAAMFALPVAAVALAVSLNDNRGPRLRTDANVVFGGMVDTQIIDQCRTARKNGTPTCAPAP